MKSAKVLEVVELGRDLFVKHIIRPLIKDHVINAILSLMRIERTGYVINRSAIKNCVDLLLQFSDSSYGTTMYRRYLQPLILRQSYVYYSAEARRLLETCDALEYLRWVNFVSCRALTNLFINDIRFEQSFSRRSRASTNAHYYKPDLLSRLFSEMLSSNHTRGHSLTRLAYVWMP